jgi:hypothetical protein
MAAQLPDVLILDGKKMDLYSNPLEPYWIFSKRKRPVFQTTASCKRGYIATWQICDKLLILKGIEASVEKRSLLFWKKTIRYSLKMLFRKERGAGVVALWFTGKIRIPHGNRTLYVHHEYDSRFEREMVITVDKGKVVKTVVLDYTQQKLQVEE